MLKRLLSTILILIVLNCGAQVRKDVSPIVKTPDSILQNFMDKRFGMFIHWGPVTLRGTEIGWSRNRQVVQDDYDSLYREFNPVLFDAENWVKTAKVAGMKYLTITARHHDGFCLWPTTFTTYNISNTPFQKDVVGLLAKACKKYDIKFCIYYSVLDWYHPDYPIHKPRGKPDENARLDRYRLYMKNQLKELITRYHPYMLWFDGNWESPWTREMGEDIYTFIKRLDASIIINNRLGKGTHKVINAETVGDYATPEQEIGKIDMTTPWESCITIGRQWSWKPNDEIKSLKQNIQTLAMTAGGNGNLLLNISPMPDGRIEQRQIDRLMEMGDWLKKNGEAIYQTKGGPYFPDSTKAFTRKGKRIYLHLFQNSNNQVLLENIPGVKVTNAFFLEGGEVRFQQNAQRISLSWSGSLPDDNDAVIVLEMDSTVEQVPLIINSTN